MNEWGIPDDLMSVLSNTVDGDEFRPLWRKAKRSGRYLLTVARLERSEGYKGVDRVLEALPAIRERCPGVRYRIVGVGDDVLRLKVLANGLGVMPHVVFEGPVSDEALLRLYSDSDLFVMLSVGEGFGIVFLEALACGVPAVAARCAGSVEALLDGRLGQLVRLEEAGAIVSAVAAALAVNESDSAGDRSARRAEVLETYGSDRFRARAREILSANLMAQQLTPGAQ
jgi:glycosyltransferase involved in cell wall biosynthesis